MEPVFPNYVNKIKKTIEGKKNENKIVRQKHNDEKTISVNYLFCSSGVLHKIMKQIHEK